MEKEQEKLIKAVNAELHICCCECDRPCKRCENTPQKCGARERKNTANHSS